MLRINNLKLPLESTAADLQTAAAAKLGCSPQQITSWRIAKKSVDARQKNNVHFVYSVDCNYGGTYPPNSDIESLATPPQIQFKIKDTGQRPVVIGSGPAGMFAGIALAEAGLRPIIIERGAPVENRRRDIEHFWQGGKLNSESNVQFGEGGAGTFSDGKLMSGIKKDMFTAKVMHELHAAGAPDEIMYLAKPHIGTDNLRKVVFNIRRKIENLGGEYRFHSKLEKLLIKNEKIIGLQINNNGTIYELATDKIFLAIGHSARDTFIMLQQCGVQMQSKPFSIGLRIEHPQTLINAAQYGKTANSPHLGAADYKIAVHLPNGRSVYTFCMCPGGSVVAAASEHGHLVTNGMSEFARNQPNANAALLVGINKEDFGSDEVLAGMYLQRRLEKAAFIAGGKNYHAPTQLVGDFLRNKTSVNGGQVVPSYLPGIEWTDLAPLFADNIAESLRLGIREMAKKLHGYDLYDAVLTGVETRSSSPVRIVRDAAMQSNIRGLFPCGEGAGYAGGITSSAADALKVVYSLCEQ